MSRRRLSLLGTVLLIICAVGSLSGCAINRATASLTPGTDFSKVKGIYVVNTPEDTRNIDELIKINLVKRGYQATNGPEMKHSYMADAVLTYVDKWIWDITMYMLELTITLRDPTSGFPMAVGNSFHTSLTRKSPEEMVDEVLTNIFSASKL